MILYYVYFSAFCKKFFCRKGNYCENLLLQHWMYFRGRRFFRFLRLTGGEETKNFFEADVIIAHFCAMSTESFENIPPHMAIFQGLKKYGSPAPKLYIGGCATEVVDLKKDIRSLTASSEEEKWLKICPNILDMIRKWMKIYPLTIMNV